MDVTVDLQALVTRSDSLVSSAIEGEVTMMNVQTGKYYGLTSVGARIWTLIEHSMPISDVCDRLLAEYRVGRDTCEREVVTFVQQMAEEGVVTVTSPHPGALHGR